MTLETFLKCFGVTLGGLGIKTPQEATSALQDRFAIVAESVQQETEQEKHRRLQLIAQGCTPEPFDGLSTREKRDLFFLHDRAINNGYHL